MIKSFKFLTKYEYHRFSPYCCYDNAKFIIETLISTDEWETTIFPKEYPHENGVWRVLYIHHRDNSYHSVVCHEPANSAHIDERFLINIDY